MGNTEKRRAFSYKVGDIVIVGGCEFCGSSRPLFCKIIEVVRKRYYISEVEYDENNHGNLNKKRRWSGCDVCSFPVNLTIKDHLFVYGNKPSEWINYGK